MKQPVLLLSVFLSSVPFLIAGSEMNGDDSNCPMHKKHSAETQQKEESSEVDRRGDEVMGFSHQTTRHHFELAKDGGVIEVMAVDPADEQTVEAIRKHLTGISKAFAKGDFSQPREIHGEMPPGASVLARSGKRVRFLFEPTEAGGIVRIVSKDREAIEAAHRFLEYQISEHRTGDH